MCVLITCLSFIRVVIFACTIAGIFFWLVPEALDRESVYLILGIVLPGIFLLAMAFGLVLRIRGILRKPPPGAEHVNKHTLKHIRALYLRPITGAAKLANLPWMLETLNGSAPGHIGGRWEVDYVGGYLLPTLAQTRLLDICMFSKIEGARLVSIDCVLDWGAAYPFRFYFENGQVIDWIAEREYLKGAKQVGIIRYPSTLYSIRKVSILLGMAIALGAPLLIGFRLEQGLSLGMAWAGLLGVNLALILQPWLVLLGSQQLFSVPYPDRKKLIPISEGVSFLHEISSLTITAGSPKELYFNRTLRGLAGEIKHPENHNLVSTAIFPAMMTSLSLFSVAVLSLSTRAWSFVLVQALLCAVLWSIVRFGIFREDIGLAGGPGDQSLPAFYWSPPEPAPVKPKGKGKRARARAAAEARARNPQAPGVPND